MLSSSQWQKDTRAIDSRMKSKDRMYSLISSGQLNQPPWVKVFSMEGVWNWNFGWFFFKGRESPLINHLSLLVLRAYSHAFSCCSEVVCLFWLPPWHIEVLGNMSWKPLHKARSLSHCARLVIEPMPPQRQARPLIYCATAGTPYKV